MLSVLRTGRLPPPRQDTWYSYLLEAGGGWLAPRERDPGTHWIGGRSRPFQEDKYFYPQRDSNTELSGCIAIRYTECTST
jgi:hypothetical protein